MSVESKKDYAETQGCCHASQETGCGGGAPEPRSAVVFKMVCLFDQRQDGMEFRLGRNGSAAIAVHASLENVCGVLKSLWASIEAHNDAGLASGAERFDENKIVFDCYAASFSVGTLPSWELKRCVYKGLGEIDGFAWHFGEGWRDLKGFYGPLSYRLDGRGHRPLKWLALLGCAAWVGPFGEVFGYERGAEHARVNSHGRGLERDLVVRKIRKSDCEKFHVLNGSD